jgi:hypothetical protein
VYSYTCKKQMHLHHTEANQLFSTVLSILWQDATVDQLSPKWGACDVSCGCGKKINLVGLAPIYCTYVVHL